jgi:hypothetical protein
MSWFAIEIAVALSPVALLLWWTVRSLRRNRTLRDEARRDGDAADAR